MWGIYSLYYFTRLQCKYHFFAMLKQRLRDLNASETLYLNRSNNTPINNIDVILTNYNIEVWMVVLIIVLLSELHIIISLNEISHINIWIKSMPVYYNDNIVCKQTLLLQAFLKVVHQLQKKRNILVYCRARTNDRACFYMLPVRRFSSYRQG